LANEGLEGEALEAAVSNALEGMRDLKKTPAVFKVRVTEESFRISPYNLRYVRSASLEAVAGEIDEKTRISIRSAQIHPILVRPAEEPGTWYVIAGVRRAAALLNNYALIRVYIPKEAREEALLSLQENVVRKGFDDYDLITVAERSGELKVEEELKNLLDERARQRLEALRRPRRIEEPLPKAGDLYERVGPVKPKPPKSFNNRPQAAQAKTQAVFSENAVERCPSCGESLVPVCSRCGAPV